MNTRVEPDDALNELSGRVIGAAVAVHRDMGPGHPESFYEAAMCVELTAQGIAFVRQHRVTVSYRGVEVGEGRIDLLVDGRLIVELKAVEKLLDLHSAQVVSYLKATRCLLGLLINFNTVRVVDGIERIIRGNH